MTKAQRKKAVQFTRMCKFWRTNDPEILKPGCLGTFSVEVVSLYLRTYQDPNNGLWGCFQNVMGHDFMHVCAVRATPSNVYIDSQDCQEGGCFEINIVQSEQPLWAAFPVVTFLFERAY